MAEPFDMEDLRRQALALAYVPAILRQLDINGRDMLVALLQAMREGGYADGFKDAQSQPKGKLVTNEA